MIVRKDQRVLEVDTATERVYDYDLKPLSVGLSYQEMSGRVPLHGATRNMVCEECYYVLGGIVTVSVDNQEDVAKPGDVVIIPKGSTSYLCTTGAKLLTFTSPDWYGSQNELIE